MRELPGSSRLSEIAISEIFQKSYIQKIGGILDLQKENDHRRIIFIDGEVKSARSNRIAQKTGTYLVNSGLLTGEQLEGLLDTVPPNTPIGQHIITSGLVSEECLSQQLQNLVRDIIIECFGWSDGWYHFVEGKPSISDDVIIHVSTATIIFQGFRDHAPEEMVDKVIRDPAEIPIPNPNIRLLYQHVTLQPEEAFVLSQVNGATPVRQLLKLLPGDPGKNRRLLASFIACGLLSFLEKQETPQTDNFFVDYIQVQKQREPYPGDAAIPDKLPVKKDVCEPLFSEEDISMMRDKIFKKHRLMDSMNHYELLECPLRATQKEIHFAFMNLCTLYHPDMAVHKEFEDLKPKLEDLFTRLEIAYRILVDQEKRQEYNRQARIFL